MSKTKIGVVVVVALLLYLGVTGKLTRFAGYVNPKA